MKQFRIVLWAWISSRVLLGLCAYLGHFAHDGAPVNPGAWEGVSNFWLNVWTTFDSKYFLEIAASGYTPTTSTFFPLYPLLLAPFGPDANSMALAGVVISNLAFLGALWLFYDLTKRDYGEQTAPLAVGALAFFPCAIYGSAVYTESLWLLLGIASFGCARRQQWMWAGIWALLAALTRNSGPVLTLALLTIWWQSSGRIRFGWVWTLLPAVAFVAMQLYFRGRFGELLASISNQDQFGRAMFWPWIPVWRDLLGIIALGHIDVITLLNWAGVIATFALVWRHRRVQPRGDAILLCGIVLLNLIFAHIWRPYTGATLRYLFRLWPFSQLLALELAALHPRSRVVASALAVMLAACLSFLFGMKEFLG